MTGDAGFDIAVIGGGIVGAATARALARRTGRAIGLLEAEERLAAHQTGNNSGVIHSGLYYKPGSLKARNCVAGREELMRFCAEHGIPHERCGKVVVARTEAELPALEELERRGRANGIEGLERLDPGALREREPHARGVAALLVPETGIVDYTAVTEVFARQVKAAGGAVRTGCRVAALRREPDGLVLEVANARGEARGAVRCRFLVNCAGLQSDRVARLCGLAPGVRIIPFRGEYYRLADKRSSLVRHLIYPVPDPRFPFLGVHFTRMIAGGVEAGPNAVLAFMREGYRKGSFSLRDFADIVCYAGFWRMAARYWRTAAGEFRRSFSKQAFVTALQGLVPAIRPDDVYPAGAGVRAQALAPDGRLLDDFHIVEGPQMIHVLNAPSPAATASISIGAAVADMVGKRLAASDWRKKNKCEE